MNVLSLFDGMSCGLVALKNLGLRVDKYYASEIDEKAMMVSQYQHGDDITYLGDVKDWKEWDLPEIDLLIGGSPCFGKGTRVLTSRGYKFIEDVKVGDEVYTHKNRFKKVLRVGNSLKETVELKAQGIKPTITTKNHPYYIREMSRVHDTTLKQKVRTFSEPLWKNAGDLRKSEDYLALPIIQEEANPLNLTMEDCWLLGRYVADGHIRKTKRKNRKNSYQYQVVYSIGNTKVDHFKSKVKRNFSCYSHSRSTYRCVVSSMDFLNLIETLGFGRKALEKRIPIEIMLLPKNLLKEFLEGYMDGDGSHKDGVFRATTVSEELILGLNLIIAKTYGTNSSYLKTIRPKTTVIEGRVVNQNDTYTTEFRKKMKRQTHARVIDDLLWLPSRGVEPTGQTCTVYNLEVEEDNSYTANNAIVHNCQAFSFSGKQLNFEDPRGKLFFEFVDIMNHFNPKYFLLENVKMKKEFEDIITSYMGVAPVELNSTLVSAQNRKRLYWTNIPFSGAPEDKGILVKDIVEDGLGVTYKGGEMETIFDKHIDGLKFSKDYLCHIGNADLNGNDSIKRVYHPEGKAPTLTTMGGGHREPKILCGSVRGRYLVDGVRQDGKGFSVAGKTTQYVEVRKDEKTNCISTVGKDNVIVYYDPILDNKFRYRKEELIWRALTPLECERLQTLADGYTKYGIETLVENGISMDGPFKTCIIPKSSVGRLNRRVNDLCLKYFGGEVKIKASIVPREFQYHDVKTNSLIRTKHDFTHVEVEGISTCSGLFNLRTSQPTILNFDGKMSRVNPMRVTQEYRRMSSSLIDNDALFSTNNKPNAFQKTHDLNGSPVNEETVVKMIEESLPELDLSKDFDKQVLLSFIITSVVTKLSRTEDLESFYIDWSHGYCSFNILSKVVPVSNSARYKMIGNGWTVDMVTHLFSPLTAFYPVVGV